MNLYASRHLEIPLLGLGTWELSSKKCTDVVSQALEIGYRHIDTALVYGNHEAIAKSIHGHKREELFITSKFPLDRVDLHAIESSVEKLCDTALRELNTEYLDLFLIHWPDYRLPMGKIFKAIESLVAKDKIKSAGVSNFTIHHLEDLEKEGCRPVVNQVEFHPYLYQKELWQYALGQHITLISFRPLGKGKLLEDPVFDEIGQRYGKNGAQVILRWMVQKNIPVIPKASSEKHLRLNFDIFDFVLSNLDMRLLDDLNLNKRFCRPDESELLY
jgi:diketogulonate reductase-like aldo/keto reductase